MIDPSSIVIVFSAPRQSPETSSLARYISEGCLDEAREGEDPRQLFTASADAWDWVTADRYLAEPGSTSLKSDIIHLTLAIKPADYELAGDTETERLDAIKASTRAILRTVQSLVEVNILRWYAGIHRNTDFPHVHIAISRRAIDQAGAETRIEELPSNLLPKNGSVRGRDQSSPLTYGILAEEFAARLAHFQSAHKSIA